MANSIWNTFLVLLAFVSGCFFTWMMTMHTLQRYEIQRLAQNINGQRIMNEYSSSDNIYKPLNRTDEARPVRVLCWVLTSPETLRSKAIGIRETWGPRCDATLYMSSKLDLEFPAVGLAVNEGRNALWNKTRAALKYIHKHHYDDADWFMKADDDTYVIVENLRHLLRDKSSSDPVYFGHHFKSYLPQGYMSGGAGYVMSKEALRRLVTNQLLVGDGNCGVNGAKTEVEDIMVGICLSVVGVKPGDSRDDQHRIRFLPFDAPTFLAHNFPDWYIKFAKYDVKPGLECCSDRLISIHYVPDRAAMSLIDYYIHGIKIEP